MIGFIINITQTIFSIIGWPFKKLQSVMKIKNIKIKQRASHLKDVRGVSFGLDDGQKVELENIDVKQEAESMRNTIGMEIKVIGKQEAELKNIEIESPIGSVKISKGVTINKQINK